MKKELSSKAIQRLTLYHFILRDYMLKGIEHISSQQIAALLKIDDSQVRKDVTFCKTQGKTKVGYNVLELRKAIEDLLGFERRKDVFIVGAGNLGFALAKYDDFKDYGLDVLALFDIDEKKVDRSINGKKIFHISKFEDLVKQMGVEIAVLTVPANVAQEVADILAKAKIKYVWNFTTTVLDVPDDIKVHNENIMGNFLDFTNK
ncbi:MAG: redox-sensing transcriptional repressor Rex [Lactobacillaceae bacterium]|jgi:redox-sensing transcriptional repressor|nr:redox-sensing transcriptional repressor Rex [Lactobacillaceae bacterium]